MRKIIVAASLVSMLSSLAFAGPNWKQELIRDLVTKKNGKMHYDVNKLCKMTTADGSEISMQVKLHSEAPDGRFISRDNFLAGTVTLTNGLVDSLKTSMQADGEVKCSDLTEVIGSPDIIFNVYMAEPGIQIETIDTATNKKDRRTARWEDV